MTIRTLVLVGGALVVATIAAGAWALTQIPADAPIPVHWGFDGQPDRFAPAWLGLFSVPAIAAITLLVLALFPRVEPRRENLRRSLTAYVAMGISVVAMAGLIQVAVVGWALGHAVDVGSLALVGIGGMFIVIGNFMSKTRSNWIMGFRTPWTLSSERSWARTHRVGGLVFVGQGVVVIVSTLLFGPQATFWLLLAMLIGGLGGLVAYSYVVWRGDPDRQQGAVSG